MLIESWLAFSWVSAGVGLLEKTGYEPQVVAVLLIQAECYTPEVKGVSRNQRSVLGYAPFSWICSLPLLGPRLGWYSVGAYFCCGGQSHLAWMCSGQSQEKGKAM